MVKEVKCDSWEDLDREHLRVLVDSTKEIYDKSGHRPINYIEQAVGPFSDREIVAKYFGDITGRGIEVGKTVLQDIYPPLLRVGTDRFQRCLGEDLARKINIRPVLADSTNLRRKITVSNSIGEAPKYKFHDGEKFEDDSFDIVRGESPYGNISSVEDKIAKAIDESVRIARPGGYTIIGEIQVIEINKDAKRIGEAIENAKVPIIDIVNTHLGKSLKPVEVITMPPYIYQTSENNPEQAIQKGDKVKYSILVHKKQ
jgi:hypothetical protein